MTAYIEEKQLERNIGISYSKGKKTIGENGERSYSLNDGFAVLDNIKGTPRYWKKAKMEMLAKLDNFGPFHIFYTLSCGDMRWNENFTSILREKGYNIIWTADDGSLDSTEVGIKVEFTKDDVIKQVELREFLEEEVDESLHEFIDFFLQKVYQFFLFFHTFFLKFYLYLDLCATIKTAIIRSPYDIISFFS